MTRLGPGAGEHGPCPLDGRFCEEPLKGQGGPRVKQGHVCRPGCGELLKGAPDQKPAYFHADKIFFRAGQGRTDQIVPQTKSQFNGQGGRSPKDLLPEDGSWKGPPGDQWGERENARGWACTGHRMPVILLNSGGQIEAVTRLPASVLFPSHSRRMSMRRSRERCLFAEKQVGRGSGSFDPTGLLSP